MAPGFLWRIIIRTAYPNIYLVANQAPDALYINRGNLNFEQVSEVAGISRDTLWTTGVTHADVNGDGLEDLYVCKPGGYRSLKRE